MKTSILTNKILAVFALAALVAGSFRAAPVSAAAGYDLSGTYTIQMEYEGTDYPHVVTLSQDEDGNLSGSGTSGAYAWTIDEGTVIDDRFEFTATYTATPDALGTVLVVDGAVEADGSLSGTWSDDYQDGARDGAISTVAGVAEEIEVEAEAAVTTKAATDVTEADATLNATNGDSAAVGHSFWVSLSPSFETDSPVIPEGVYSTPDLGALAANADFSASLSEVDGLPEVTADTTYYYAAWVNVDGTWIPGEIMSVTTDELAVDEYPETSTVTIVKYVDGVPATGVSADNADFTMNATWVADNLNEGEESSGQFALSENGFNGGLPYQATTSEMTNGASYSVSEVLDANTGASCAEDKAYALQGYTVGDSLAEAALGTPSSAASLTDINEDQYIIVWNDDCSTEDDDGTIGGEVEPGTGVLAVTSVEVIDSSATANNSYADGWEYVFHITVPTNETDIAMKFSDWEKTGDESETIPAGGNMRISSEQADNGPFEIAAADTYSAELDINASEDLDPETDGIQIEVTVEVKIPSGTESGSYTTDYGVRSEPAAI